MNMKKPDTEKLTMESNLDGSPIDVAATSPERTDGSGEDASALEPLSPGEILGWVELGCWTMVALAPFLYWVNGPAVSTDQFVVRTGLVTLALVGGPDDPRDKVASSGLGRRLPGNASRSDLPPLRESSCLVAS